MCFPRNTFSSQQKSRCYLGLSNVNSKDNGTRFVDVDLVSFVLTWSRCFLTRSMFFGKCLVLTRYSEQQNLIHYSWVLGFFKTREFFSQETLILPAPNISESCIKIKINLNFNYSLLCGASKGIKCLHKTFWGNRKNCNKKFKLIFFLRPGWRWEGLKRCLRMCLVEITTQSYSK